MIFARPPIRRTRQGGLAVTLSDQERELLAGLADQLAELLTDPDESSLIRLFPPAYQGAEHADLADEYRKLMTDDLASRHGEAVATLAATAHATELTEAEGEAWMRALNQLRLTLGTRLGVETDDDEVGMDTAEGQVYHLLAFLQECLVEALSSPS